MTHAQPPLILAGLGHSHLFVLEARARGALRDIPLLLVTPPEYYYSGMVPGVLSGAYVSEQARLDPGRLARAAGAEWISGRVDRIEAGAHRVRLEDDSTLDYRLLSVDIGSRTAGEELPGVGEHAFPVKPVGEVLRFCTAAEHALARATPEALVRLVIVGGGSAAVEIAFCIDARLGRGWGRERFRLTLVERGDKILESYPADFRERAGTLLRQRGVDLRLNEEVQGVDDGTLRTASGSPLPYDVLLWATGPSAPPVFRRSGLAVDQRGYLCVTQTLRVVDQADIFAAGDCISLAGHPRLDKAGVYAVREGPVLARNLANAVRGEPLERYEPQQDWLSLLSTGDGRALLRYRGFTRHGRSAGKLKDFIDRRFVRRFQRLNASPEER